MYKKKKEGRFRNKRRKEEHSMFATQSFVHGDMHTWVPRGCQPSCSKYLKKTALSWGGFREGDRLGLTELLMPYQESQIPTCRQWEAIKGVCVFLIVLNHCVLSSFKLCPTLCNPLDPPGSSPWDSPGKNTGMGCHAVLQGIFPTQGSSQRLLTSLALAGGFFTTSATWEALKTLWFIIIN